MYFYNYKFAPFCGALVEVGQTLCGCRALYDQATSILKRALYSSVGPVI